MCHLRGISITRKSACTSKPADKCVILQNTCCVCFQSCFPGAGGGGLWGMSRDQDDVRGRAQGSETVSSPSSSLPTFTRKTTETTKKANRICHSTSKKWPALTVNLYATRTLPADWVRKAAVLGERTAAAQNERAHAGGSSG